jgi:hypothetical protein
VAVAYHAVQLPIRNIEELLRLAIRIVVETGGAKDGIRKGD